MSSRSAVNWVALILLIIGGLNWGLMGLFAFNFIDVILGGAEWLERLIYIVVGLAAIYCAVKCPRLAKDAPAATRH